MSEQIHYLMRKPATGIQRSVWVSPVSGQMFCGICLRGRIEARIGATCASCDSQVVADFTALPGGVRRPAYAAIRAEKRKRETERSVAAARLGNVLTMRAG